MKNIKAEEAIFQLLRDVPWLPSGMTASRRLVSFEETVERSIGFYTEYTTHMVVKYESSIGNMRQRNQWKRIAYSGDFHISIREVPTSSTEGAFWIYPTPAAYGFAPQHANIFLILAWLGIPLFFLGLLIGTVTLFKSWDYFTTHLTGIPSVIMGVMFIGWTIPIYKVHRQLTDNNRIMESLSGLSILPADEVYLKGITFGGDLKGKRLEEVALTYLALRKQLDFPVGPVKDAAPIVDWSPQRWIVTTENVGKDKEKEARAVGLAVEWMRRISR